MSPHSWLIELPIRQRHMIQNFVIDKNKLAVYLSIHLTSSNDNPDNMESLSNDLNVNL